MNNILAQDTIVSMFRRRTVELPFQKIYKIINHRGDVVEDVTFMELHQRTSDVARLLLTVTRPGDRVILSYVSITDFIIAFFACLRARVVAVPVEPPAGLRAGAKFMAIAKDAQAKWVCTSADQEEFINTVIRQVDEDSLHCVVTSASPAMTISDVDLPAVDLDQIAYLQYTSGTTADPKGVIITHRNLMHNLTLMKQRFEVGECSVGLSWLPLFHDMGLLSGILLPIFAAFPVYLAKPTTFLRKPVWWLQMISRYGVTHSGAPNFAYDLCNQRIDSDALTDVSLATWQVAFCGSETVRAATMSQFYHRFAPFGLSATALNPCYGMAEATLLVTCGSAQQGLNCLHVDKAALYDSNEMVLTKESADTLPLVSVGEVEQDLEIRIICPQTLALLTDDVIGEIVLSGASVTPGYWNNIHLTEAMFVSVDEQGMQRKYYRTGDLGCLHAGQLYITGRLKELIIVKGRNHYPQDIEWIAQKTHQNLRVNCGAAFSVDQNGEEKIILIQEVLRNSMSFPELEELAASVRLNLIQHQRVELHDLVLVKQSTLPLTSSGKVRRMKVKEMYESGQVRPFVI